MKKQTLLLVFTALLLALCNTCKKDDDGEPLPPYTEIGANTFTFRVNGKVYEPEVGYLPAFPRIGVSYNHIDTFLHYDYLFAIDANKVYLEHNKSIGFLIVKMPRTGKYQLSNVYTPPKIGGSAYYWDKKPVEKYYYTDSDYTGEVNITRLDTINHIIAGKFKFKAMRWCLDKKCGEVVTVDGQFDVKYKPNIKTNYY